MSNNPYTDACKEIESILTSMTDSDLVDLMRSIDCFSTKFDGLFSPVSIGDLIEGGYDGTDIADACIACGAKDYESEVRHGINGGWKSASLEDMAEDARFYADDAAEWLLDHGEDAEFLDWPIETHYEFGRTRVESPTMEKVLAIYEQYWDEFAA